MVKSDDGINDSLKGEFTDSDISLNLIQKKRRPSHPNSSAKIYPNFQSQIEKTSNNIKPVKYSYSGLSNQGATCYLNSLLQSLFMTPEFRFNILKWKYDPNLHGPKEDCIPFQLQKLFVRLYSKIRAAEETKDLTKSFQWTSSEAWEQHDIQELCRVLFDAIEMSLDPNDKNFINELYEGNTISIVECQECNYMSQRFDKFLDLSLPIRNDFDKIYNKSLTMAIYNFLKPEILSEDNKYECEKCCKKVDALKYSKFSKLPKILFVSLMRFDYDIMTYQRKKINDKVTFSLLLNFNKYLKDHKDITYDGKSEENEDLCLFLKEEEDNVKGERDEEGNKLNKNSEDKFKKISFNKELYEQKIKDYLEDGPDVYELFSIVVHSGSALGGHYYAYIKSLDDLSWYCFNDSSVSKLEVSDIRKIFGGNSSSNSYGSSSGYVLIYRKLNTEMESISISLNHDDYMSLINEELRKEIEEENLKIQEEEKKWFERFTNISIKVLLNNESKTINAKKTDTVIELKRRILIEYGLTDKYDEKDVKLRAYNQSNSKSGEYYDQDDSTLEDSYILSCKQYTLEFRSLCSGSFPIYDPNEITLYIYPWRDENENKVESELGFDVMKINNRDTIWELRQRIVESYSTIDSDKNNLIIFRKHEFSSTNFSVTEIMKKEEQAKQIYRYPILDGTKLFIEFKEENSQSKFYKLLNDKLSFINIRFNFPVDFKLISKNNVSVKHYKLDNEIAANKSWTVKKIKELISEFLHLNLNEFIMRKHNHNGDEVRNLNETVNDLVKGIMTSMCIYVELGTPLDEDDEIVKVILCREDYSKFKFFPYKLIEVGSCLIKKSWSIKDLKRNLIEEVDKRIGEKLEMESVLIRDCVTDRPAKIYLDHQRIENLNFSENKKILVHEYNSSKIFSKNFDVTSVQVCVRFWDRTNWILMEPHEILISKKSKIQELFSILTEIYPDVAPENLNVYKIINGFNTYMDDVNKFQFVRLVEKLEMDCDSFPFFLSLDGNLLIVTDSSMELTEPSDEARKYYCRQTLRNDSFSTALVLVPNKEESLTSGITSDLSQNKSRVEEMIEKFETKDNSLKDKLASNISRFKEKGLVIKVKRNQIEEVVTASENKSVIDNMKNEKNIVSSSQNELKNKNSAQLMENNTSKGVVDYSDYSIEAENEFLEPLI